MVVAGVAFVFVEDEAVVSRWAAITGTVVVATKSVGRSFVAAGAGLAAYESWHASEGETTRP